MPPRKPRQSDVGTPVGSVETEPVAPKTRASRNEVVLEPKMAFSTWFMIKVQDDSRLKVHHQETLRAYMTSHGLSAEEPRGRYDAALRSYFGA